MPNSFGHRSQVFPVLSALAVALVAACGGDAKPAPDANAPPSPAKAVSATDFRLQQTRYADSVLNAAQTAKQIVTRLGTEYAVGPVRLRDSLGVLTEKANCLAQGRQLDPYLAGTVSYFVFMSAIGSTIVRIQEAQWTSQAGNVVSACLNVAAKAWQFDPTFGKPATYVTQVQLKSLAATASK